MTFKELQPQLLALTLEEKSQVIQILVQSLSNTWQGIEKILESWVGMLAFVKLAYSYGC